MNMRNHLFLNAARYITFNFARMLVKFHYDAINVRAASQNYTIQIYRFRCACHVCYLDHCKRIFAKTLWPGRKKQLEYLCKRMWSKNKSPPPCIWQDSSVRSYIDIYQPAGKRTKKSNVRHEWSRCNLHFTMQWHGVL